VHALFRAGHRAARGDLADLLLIDIDPPAMADRFEVPWFPHRQIIDHYKSAGASVLLCPHGVNPALYYDGLFEPDESVHARLVQAIGYAEFLRRVESPGEVAVVGWALCDQLPFTPRQDVRRILFAPLHPSGGAGEIPIEASSAANAALYERLLAAPWELTVRIVGTPEHNGLWPADGVRFVPGGNHGLRDIRAADVVVGGAGTFPSLAIARGVPTVIYAHCEQAMYGLPGEQPGDLLRPDRYVDYIRYPFDPNDGPLDEVVHAAARSEEPILTWKRRFIGEPFDDAAAVATVERIVRGTPEPWPLKTRSLTVVALADEVLERPDLLASYAALFSPDDDATLVLWGPGVKQPTLLAMVGDAARAAGLDPSRLPHHVPLARADIAETDRLLADYADALLSEWPAVGRIAGLPHYGAAEIEHLRVSARGLRSGPRAGSRPL
jgi:hypothetical protein